jgi:hypothetical protein
MSARRLMTAATLVVALAFSLVQTLDSASAQRASAQSVAKTTKPNPAEPRGPRTIYPLTQFGPDPATDDVALKWSEQTLAVIREVPIAPTVVSRVLAVVQTSVYDAWAGYDPVAVGTRLGGSLRRPAAERTLDNKSMAISYAAYRALIDLFPTGQRNSDVVGFMTALGYDPAFVSTDPDHAPAELVAAAVGNRAAQAVLAFRHTDGSNQSGGYADTTNYIPVNSPDEIIDPFQWQPLRVNGAPQVYSTPQWGTVTPFALTAPNQFAVPGPDLRKDYKKALKDVVKFSAKLSDTDKVIAEYWADGPRSELPPGHGAIFAAALCRVRGQNLDNDVKLLFLQANAVLDAGIAAWYYKRQYNFVRPITLVHALMKDEKIKAWGGPYQGTVQMMGQDWQPYQPTTVVTPPFPEYVSGHSTFTAATDQVVRAFTGTDTINLSVTIPKGSSRVEPGTVPAQAITLTWRTMQDAADQAGLSREYGGIHFHEGDMDGRALGTQIGQTVFAKAQTYFNGTATAP